MKINRKIIETLKRHKISVDNAMPLLFSVQYNYIPDYIPLSLVTSLTQVGILKANEKTKRVELAVGLYDNAEEAFGWVEDEYIKIFTNYLGDSVVVNKAECIKRMKRFFSEHPSIRKEDVLKATERYVKSETFTRRPHYFIYKGSGINRISDLKAWVDKVKKEEDQASNYTSQRNILK